MKQNSSKQQKQPAKQKPLSQRVATQNQHARVTVVREPIVKTVKRETYFGVTAGPMRDSIRVRGQDLLGPVLLQTTPGSIGQTLQEYYINPATLGKTRLAQFSQLYEKYIFRKLRFHYTASQPTTVNGQVLLAYDRDVNDPTPQANLDGVKQYLAMEGSKVTPVYCSETVECPLLCPTEPLFCNVVDSQSAADDRLTYQGQFYVACAMPFVGVANGSYLGMIWIEYECDLFIPQLEPLTPVTQFTAGSFTASPINTNLIQLMQANSPVRSGANASYAQFTPDNHLRLPEGLHQVITMMTQTGGGLPGLGQGIQNLVALEPNPAQPPSIYSPYVKQSNGTGSTSISMSYVNAPPGGVTLDVLVGTTASAPVTAPIINVTKIGGYSESGVGLY